MSWLDNPIMEWSDNGTTWHKVPDHGRSPLIVSFERIGNSHRMANGTLRRYTVTKKRTFSCSWENIPSKVVSLLAGYNGGDWIETWHNAHDGEFDMRLSDGDSTFETFKVMISDFSKEITKRNPNFDLWNLDISLEEC